MDISVINVNKKSLMGMDRLLGDPGADRLYSNFRCLYTKPEMVSCNYDFCNSNHSYGALAQTNFSYTSSVTILN